MVLNDMMYDKNVLKSRNQYNETTSVKVLLGMKQNIRGRRKCPQV